MTVPRRSVLLASAPAVGACSPPPPRRPRTRSSAPPPTEAAEAAASVSGRHAVALRDGRRFALVNPG
ncbi:hypothetical protein NFX46_14295 [Streptomyces phaeoluteigriseus]|uniref:Uncharacterized protein n=1 Tax=Streptomyces phaeoluteigriseus TaxID=114686 RepID=A0ABY4Z748_9ACTN|nr:hypothetical protein [Streptomyces phaeoluteigriseus]USQ84862.1 hypothetical protein NFX46_14295 [Streptomyces phaeoluteigriseus]